VSWQTRPAARLEARSRTAYLDQRLSPSAFGFVLISERTPARQEDADSEIHRNSLRLDRQFRDEMVAGAYYHRSSSQTRPASSIKRDGGGSLPTLSTLTSPSYALSGQVTYPVTSTFT